MHINTAISKIADMCHQIDNDILSLENPEEITYTLQTAFHGFITDSHFNQTFDDHEGNVSMFTGPPLNPPTTQDGLIERIDLAKRFLEEKSAEIMAQVIAVGDYQEKEPPQAFEIPQEVIEYADKAAREIAAQVEDTPEHSAEVDHGPFGPLGRQTPTDHTL